MKLLATAAFALSALFAFNAQAETAEMPTCNHNQDRCIIEWGFDSYGGLFKSCIDVPSTSSCSATPTMNRYCASGDPEWLGIDDCGGARSAEYTTPNASEIIQEQDYITGDRSSYLGWRLNTQMSATAVTNSSRAKLHACSQSGSQDESTYDTYSECTANAFGETEHAKNVACSDTTWDTLCASWPGTSAK